MPSIWGKKSSELYSTVGPYGIDTIADPPEADLDIVFVHGLTGNWKTTWTKKTGEGDVFWPKSLLPQDLPRARIMTYGFDADIIQALDVASSNTLRDHGKSLASDLARKRRRTRTDSRHIIFVAHSLGGLVCEEALLVSRGAAEDHVNALLESTVAIAFMGTPHAGSDLARWGAVLSGLSSVLKRTNQEIVRVLQPGSEMLATVQQEFHGLLEQRQIQQKPKISIFCFYEEKAITGLGKIVPDASAILARYPNQSIHGDHMEMTKFSGSNDPGYRAVADQLWIWADNLRNGYSALPAMQQRRLQGTNNMTEQPVAFAVNSGGGAVVLGSQNATRDINNYF